MKTSPILKVAMLEEGSMIAVFPKSKEPDYQYVYREASGVYWNPTLGCFHSTPVREWTPQRWFQQIVATVKSGIGLQMVLTAETKYESPEDGFEEAIKSADQDLWR